MRLWSLHPHYLDGKGLVALWREALLARKVLQGQTRGYRQHPQLARFKALPEPLAAIDFYLQGVYAEAVCRGYHFAAGKLGEGSPFVQIRVTEGQLLYERQHLLRKLKERDLPGYQSLLAVQEPQAHPLFTVVAGGVEPWERVV